MAFMKNFSLQLIFSLVLLLFSSEVFSATGSPYCPPSSCGSIPNISYPFRLKDDPKNCGDSRYELVCENNLTTVYLNSKRFLVLSITYENYTIRLVDPGLANYDRYSSCPLNYLTSNGEAWSLFRIHTYTHEYGSEDINRLLVFISCAAHLKTPLSRDSFSEIHETAFCGDKESILSNSSFLAQQNYSYVISGEANLSSIPDSCSVKRVTLVSKNAPILLTVGNSPFSNCSYGFELLWYRVYCRRCNGHCYLSSKTGPVKCLNDALSRSNDALSRWKEFLHGILYFFSWTFPHTLIYIAMALGARFILGILCLFAFVVYKMRRRHMSIFENIENFLQGNNNLVPIRYSYAEIKRMTNNFRDKLGEGGYGTVFKGKLRSGSLVAVKMMGKSKANGEEFISEVATIGRVHHVNVVNLIGFCYQASKRALVYEFMANGSLEKYIFPQDGEMKFSNWEKMFKISLGVAQGMDYLHRGCEMQILHFDIKPHNILLDENFNPKISDFGLAKLYPANDSIVSLTAARGTMGYMAPELFYKNIGRVSYKADVYSFGMLLMEMAGKRKNLNPFVDHVSQIYFPSWVHNQFSQGKEIEMGDATEDERKMVKKMILVALWCIQMKPTDRPSMNKVVEMLEGDLDLLEMPPKPFLSPEGMEDDHRDHRDNAELPLLSASNKGSGIMEIEMG